MRAFSIRAVLGAVMLCGIMFAGDAPAFKSKAVKYAKINLSSDGTKAVVLAFDESNGTGSGYDTIKVMPVGFKHEAKTVTAKNAQNNAKPPVKATFVQNVFEPIELGPFAKAAGVPTPVMENIIVMYFRQGEMEIIQANGAAEKKEGSDTWKCTAGSQLKTAESQADALAITFPDKASLKLTARQVKNKDNVEAGVSVVMGEMDANVMKNDKAQEMTVTVKDKNGDVVKKDAGDSSKFSFG